MLARHPVLGHVRVDHGPGLQEELPEQRLADLLVQSPHVHRGICEESRPIKSQPPEPRRPPRQPLIQKAAPQPLFPSNQSLPTTRSAASPGPQGAQNPLQCLVVYAGYTKDSPFPQNPPQHPTTPLVQPKSPQDPRGIHLSVAPISPVPPDAPPDTPPVPPDTPSRCPRTSPRCPRTRPPLPPWFRSEIGPAAILSRSRSARAAPQARRHARRT